MSEVEKDYSRPHPMAQAYRALHIRAVEGRGECMMDRMIDREGLDLSDDDASSIHLQSTEYMQNSHSRDAEV